MNWYNSLKLAQIWNVESDGSFLDEVQKLYELEYKRSMIIQNPFKGVEARKENILAQIEKGILETIDFVKAPLINTLKQWLSSHALTDPDLWATQRNKPGSRYADWSEYYMASGENAESRLISAIEEYYRLTEQEQQRQYGQMPQWGNMFKKMMADNNGYSLPSMHNIVNLLIPDRREMLFQDLQNEGLEEFNEMIGTQFATEQEAQTYINQTTADELGLDFSDIFEYYGFEEFAQLADENELLDNLVFDINKNIIFPLWYGKWSQEGIEDTREAVENIYQELVSAKTLNQTIPAINLTLNAAHQTGDMIDYLEDYGDVEDSYETKQFLDNLSAGAYVEEWNDELRAIGVEI